MKRIATVSVVSVVALAGCGGGDEPKQEPTSDPPIGSFVSTSDVKGDGLAFSTPVRVRIGEAYVGWKARCNGSGARHVLITDDQLMVRDARIDSTLIGCARALRNQDRQITAFFRSNPQWQLDGNILTLSSETVEVRLQRDGTTPNS